MAENLSLLEINALMKQDNIAGTDQFVLLKSLLSHVNQGSEYLLQEVVLRVLEKRDQFQGYKAMVSDLARSTGLFPYLNQQELSIADKIAYEFHKPDSIINENIVFHRLQAKVYFDLLDGKNVILSAPTSFGKSLIIDSIVATGKFRNIAIVLPTIALIDETRKRLSKFKESYKIITHSSQKPADRNIFVLTQERVMEVINDIKIEFFVIDEFYKIQPTPSDQERSIILNQAFYKLLKKGGQFYLLGPNIENINNEVFPDNVSYTFMKTDYKTVVTERIKVNIKNSAEETLLSLCAAFEDPTLIYCASPASANRVAKLLFESDLFSKTTLNDNAANWLREEFHEQWYLPKALESGMGIHHGKIPRAISQYAVKAFNEGKINFLICTSTLIEGVNTKAKNVVIFDNKVAREKFDFFTFNNICGRSGRMFQHFIGKVYLFHEPPVEELPFVDFPLFSQDIDVPENLLIQMDDDDLSEDSLSRIHDIRNNGVLSLETIKRNSNIDPDGQIRLATYLSKNYRKHHAELRWNWMPTYEQLLAVCNLIWDYFIGSGRLGNISSGKQLAFKINGIRIHRNIFALIASEVSNTKDPEKVNEAIENVLDFVRFWGQYNFPKFLLALDRIQKEVYREAGLSQGDYSSFASQIECLFTEPLFVALDEYGIPIQTSSKIRQNLSTANADLDSLLEQIKKINVSALNVTEFDKDLLMEAQKHI